MNLRRTIEARVCEAMSAVGAEGSPALVSTAARPEFGDYQANGVMAAAKQLKTNPRQLAQQVLEKLDLSDIAEKVKIAGPGFINIHLKADWLGRRLTDIADDEHLGMSRSGGPETIVVDYSGPNLAKEMHAGHLRSTIIGDALCRVLEFRGHRVIRQNHVGDWGTQFGMLIAFMRREAQRGADLAEDLADLEAFYQKAKQLFDDDQAFADEARQYVVKLQGGDEDCRRKWRQFLDESLRHCEEIYNRLNVELTREDVRGESAYNDDLPKVVADLGAAGLLKESQGAQCVFLEQFTGKEGETLPLIVQKSDGGYLYATTDLAAIRHRRGALHADRVLYVTDARQSLHFQQVFAAAQAATFAPESMRLEHVAFGVMLGADKRPFKTREGSTVKLRDLLDEAERRAFDLVSEKSPDLPEAQWRKIARTVGVGAVKYADLSQNRTSDYVFSYDKMLSLEGNTAPYMQYAYARVRSIFRKGGEEAVAGEIRLVVPAERVLGVKLLQFVEALEQVADDCMPNVLCAYLYELAGAFMSFYESCPVLKADNEAMRTSRLLLAELTARTIRVGLGLLGIETIDQM